MTRFSEYSLTGAPPLTSLVEISNLKTPLSIYLNKYIVSISDEFASSRIICMSATACT